MFKSSLQELVKKQISEKQISINDIVTKLEYVNISIASERVERIVNSPMLTFGKGEYDYRFVTYEAVEAICTVLGISKSNYKSGFKEIKDELTRIKNRYKAYIQIFSEKEPEVRGFFSYMGITSAKRISLEVDFVDKPLDEQKRLVKIICKKHYKEKKRSLGRAFGNIVFYRYFYSDSDFIDIEKPNEKK